MEIFGGHGILNGVCKGISQNTANCDISKGYSSSSTGRDFIGNSVEDINRLYQKSTMLRNGIIQQDWIVY